MGQARRKRVSGTSFWVVLKHASLYDWESLSVVVPLVRNLLPINSGEIGHFTHVICDNSLHHVATAEDVPTLKQGFRLKGLDQYEEAKTSKR